MAAQQYTINQFGREVCDLLDGKKIHLTGEADGRLESLNCEINVTDQIRENFPHVKFTEKGSNRAFGDITPLIGGMKYPINVKMVNSEKSKTFNGGGPKMINYILFGGGQISHRALAEKIKKIKPKKCAKQGYYLIYYKNDPLKTIFCSLANLDKDSVITNPSNPIQLKTTINTVERTDEEQAEFVIGLFKEIQYKRAMPYFILAPLESPLQRLQRLQGEVKELCDDLASLAEKNTGGGRVREAALSHPSSP